MFSFIKKIIIGVFSYLFKDKRINYFLRKNKKGRGSAVLYGFRKALKNKSNKIFVEMDADFSHNPSELPRNIKYFLRKYSIF